MVFEVNKRFRPRNVGLMSQRQQKLNKNKEQIEKSSANEKLFKGVAKKKLRTNPNANVKFSKAKKRKMLKKLQKERNIVVNEIEMEESNDNEVSMEEDTTPAVNPSSRGTTLGAPQ